MRHLFSLIGSFFAVMFMLMSPGVAHAQNYDVMPKRTWGSSEDTQKSQRKVYKPYNLKSILKGRKDTDSPKKIARKQSRNPLELARMGELPYTDVLKYTADANTLRMSLQLYDPYRGMSEKKARESRERLKAQGQKNAAALLKKRNDYYRKKGISDEYTEFSDQQNGRSGARNNRYLTRGNSTSARASSQKAPPIPSEVRLFMEETKRLSGLKLKPGTTYTDEALQASIAKPLTRERDKFLNEQRRGVTRNVVVNRGEKSSNIVVPTKEQKTPLLKRVFPFFY
jgi:hypothetical protein